MREVWITSSLPSVLCKQVPSANFPMQAVETNIIGTNNVLESAIRHGVKKIVVLLQDKELHILSMLWVS